MGKTVKISEKEYEKAEKLLDEGVFGSISEGFNVAMRLYDPSRIKSLEEGLRDAEKRENFLELELQRRDKDLAELDKRVLELEKAKKDLEDALEDAAQRWMEEHPSKEESRPDPVMEWIEENEFYYPPTGKRTQTPKELEWLFTNAKEWAEKWPLDVLDMITVSERKGIMTELWLKGKFKEHGDPREGHYDTKRWEFHVGKAPKENDRFMQTLKTKKRKTLKGMGFKWSD